MLNRLFDRMNRPAWFVVPYWFLFAFFIVIPVFAAFALSFTFFNSIQAPTFVGINNYIELITLDTVFMRYVLPNTLRFAFIVGPVGMLCHSSLPGCYLIYQNPQEPFLRLFFTPVH